MIKTAKQLKDLIRNLSKKKSADAQILMRNYMMERFLERISLSQYQDKFILKGGMLVAAMVGLDARATMGTYICFDFLLEMPWYSFFMLEYNILLTLVRLTDIL